MDLRLSEDERAFLFELLDSDFHELKAEINKTEDYDYKNALKAREQVLTSLMARLEAAPA